MGVCCKSFPGGSRKLRPSRAFTRAIGLSHGKFGYFGLISIMVQALHGWFHCLVYSALR